MTRQIGNNPNEVRSHISSKRVPTPLSSRKFLSFPLFFRVDFFVPPRLVFPCAVVSLLFHCQGLLLVQPSLPPPSHGALDLTQKILASGDEIRQETCYHVYILLRFSPHFMNFIPEDRSRHFCRRAASICTHHPPDFFCLGLPPFLFLLFRESMSRLVSFSFLFHFLRRSSSFCLLGDTSSSSFSSIPGEEEEEERGNKPTPEEEPSIFGSDQHFPTLSCVDYKTAVQTQNPIMWNIKICIINV